MGGFAVRLFAVVLSVAASLFVYSSAIRPWFLHWGATPTEAVETDTTDLLVAPSGESGATRAITVEAPTRDVWPWVAQVGQGRGGFYSYDILENVLFQCDIHSVDRLLPQFDHPKTGDEFSFCSHGPPVTRTTLYVEPDRAIAYSPGWALIVRPTAAGQTRLIARSRGPRQPQLGALADFFAWNVAFDTVHFVMERKMLEGIKRRAEGAPTFSALEDDLQVLSWTVAFLVMVGASIAVFFGQRYAPQLALAWGGFGVWMFLMLVQPSVVVSLALIGVLLYAALGIARNARAFDKGNRRG